MRLAAVPCALALLLVMGVPPAVAQTAYPPLWTDGPGPPGDLLIGLPSYRSADKSAPSAGAAEVGDVDGDGLEDTAIILQSYEESFPSGVWVTFTPATLPAATPVAAGEPGWRGMRLIGGGGGHQVTGLRDVNGDGRDEVVVNGTAVVYGRAEGGTVDLADLGDAGFRLPGHAGGGQGVGSATGGIQMFNSQLADAGDQNGDGRADVAYLTGHGAAVAHTPADAGEMAPVGWEVRLPGPETGAGRPHVVALDSVGDLDGDGRTDLALFWTSGDAPDASTAHVSFVAAPAPAGPPVAIDLEDAIDAGRAADVAAPGKSARNGIAAGDRDGDGRVDVVLVSTGNGTWSTFAVRAPELGTRTTAIEPPPGQLGPGLGPGVVDVGDQDGDGVHDLASGSTLAYSRGGWSMYDGRFPADLGRRGAMFAGSVRDRDGDARRELFAVYASPYNNDNRVGEYRADWKTELFLSKRAPAPATPTPTPTPRPPVPVATPRPRPYPSATPTPVPKGRLLQGTRRADRLRGAAGRDTLRGLGGRDDLDGRGGQDKLYGGAGDDVLRARDGVRDLVDCGSGRRDRATVDRRDRVRSCEKVSRPKR